MEPTQPTGGERPAPSQRPVAPRGAASNGAIALADLGKTLRVLRRDRGSSLAAVAEGTGLSQSFISLVESGKSDISFGRLIRLLDHYGVGLADVLPRQEPQAADVVTPQTRLHVYSPTEGIEMFLLTPDTHRTMMMLLATYEPHGKTAEFTRHPGEEFIFVLEGTIQLTLKGSEPVTLGEGDSVYFQADTPHLLANPGTQRTRLMAAITPPTW